MNSEEEKRRKISNQPPEGLESPFLGGELFAREVDEEGEARLTALEAESVFQRAFEPDQTKLIEPEEPEEEFVEEEEWVGAYDSPAEEAESYGEEASVDLEDEEAYDEEEVQYVEGEAEEEKALARMKFEFQTQNRIWRNDGTTSSKLDRKYGPNDFLVDNKGVRLESETDGVLEFETEWFRTWPKLKEAIEKAVKMTEDMNNAAPSKYNHTRKAFPFNIDHLRRGSAKEKSQGFWDKREGMEGGRERILRQTEELEIEIIDAKWWATIQSSECFLLEYYESFLRQHEEPSRANDTINHAKAILNTANTDGLSVTELAKLRSFLQIITNYIMHGTRNDVKGHPAKFAFRLMSRTNFASMYRWLLTQKEKKLFQKIVRTNGILNEMGLNRRTPVFINGYGTMRHEPGPTVHEWLSGIVSGVDLLSARSGRGLSAAMGRYNVETRRGKKDRWLVKFETRGTIMGRVFEPKDWVAYASKLFHLASRRERDAIKLALQQGIRDGKELTNFVFHARHPELGGRQIREGERELAQEWLWIRGHLVLPRLLNPFGRKPQNIQPELEELEDIENQYERSYHFISDSEDYTGDEEAEDMSQREFNTTMDDEYIESELFPETEDELESGDDEFEDDAEAFYWNIDHELAEEPEPFDEEVFAGTETGIVGSDNTGDYEDYVFESIVEQATQDDLVEFNVEEMRCNESPMDDWEQDMLLEEIAELLPHREFPSVIGQMSVAYETPPLPRGVPAFEHWFQSMKRNTTTNKWIPNGPEKKLESINPGFFDPTSGGLKIASPLNNSLKNLLMTNSEFNHYLSRDALLDGAAKGRDKIRVALVDLTGSKLLNPEFAGWGSSVAVNGASCPKVAALYAAFQLLNDLKHIASSLGISERSALIRSMSNHWRRVIGRPKLERFLGTSNPPNLEFSNAVKTAIANIIHPHEANHAASVLIDVVGFPFIASLMWQSGLRHPTLGGLWLTSSYPPGARWGNPVKPPPLPVYGHNATALSLAAFFTLLAQGRLVNLSTSSNIKSALSTASWFMGVLPLSAPNAPQKIASKVGLLTKHVHEAGFIENGQFRYAVAIMTTGIRAGEGIELLRKLIVKLDSLIRTNNP